MKLTRAQFLKALPAAALVLAGCTAAPTAPADTDELMFDHAYPLDYATQFTADCYADGSTLLTIPDADIDANAVVRMVDIGVKVERLSRGEPTENRTVTHGGALEVENTQRADLSALSDEELNQLAGLLEKSSPG